MQKTIFEISQMDCPSEENLIRLKLAEISEIKNLDFDIPNRKLIIFHFSKKEKIGNALAKLKLGEKHLETSEVENQDFSEDKMQRKLLWTVLLINLIFSKNGINFQIMIILSVRNMLILLELTFYLHRLTLMQ